MNITVSNGLKKIGGLFYRISKNISPKSKIGQTDQSQIRQLSLQAIRFKTWFSNNGDKTHRLNYDLNEDSIVFDLGGYEGEWAGNIFCMYGASIYIFEPHEPYFKNIKNKFLHNKKIQIFQIGLSKTIQTRKLAIADNSSSIFMDSENSVDIKLVSANIFFNEYQIRIIDLMKINIEGGEYDLLEHLIETGDVEKIKNIQVQFHDFVPDAENRMKSIQADLCRTHELTYQYEFVWENWKLKTV